MVNTGNAFVTGNTVYSSDFPTTTGTYDPTFNGVADAFIAKMNPKNSGILSL